MSDSQQPNPLPEVTPADIRSHAVRLAVAVLREHMGDIPMVIILPSAEADREVMGIRSGPFVKVSGCLAAAIGMVEGAYQSAWPSTLEGPVKLNGTWGDQDGQEAEVE